MRGRKRRRGRSSADGGRVRYAVVGLGYIAQASVLPAFAHARNSEICALVSHDPKKLRELGRRYRVEHLYGDLQLDSAYELSEKMSMTITIGEKRKKKTFPKTDQFAPELVHFSECVRAGKEPRPSGREGLADVALYRSAEAGAPVRLGERRPGAHPKPSQLLERPPVRERELVRAAPPSGVTTSR